MMQWRHVLIGARCQFVGENFMQFALGGSVQERLMLVADDARDVVQRCLIRARLEKDVLI